MDLMDHMARFTVKLNVSHLCPWNPHIPINVCVLNPQNRAHFSEMINLRDHMPRFTLKMNVFPSIFLETPSMCVF